VARPGLFWLLADGMTLLSVTDPAIQFSSHIRGCGLVPISRESLLITRCPLGDAPAGLGSTSSLTIIHHPHARQTPWSPYDEASSNVAEPEAAFWLQPRPKLRSGVVERHVSGPQLRRDSR